MVAVGKSPAATTNPFNISSYKNAGTLPYGATNANTYLPPQPMIDTAGTPGLGPLPDASGTTSENLGPQYDFTQGYAPQSYSATDLYGTFKNTLDKPQTIVPQNTYSMFANRGPVQVQGLGDDYFSQQRESRKEALRNEFFGPMGVLSEQAAGESAAGRLGSGVGKRVLEATVTNPFAQQFSQIDRDVAMEQAKERARVQELNVTSQNAYRDFMGKLAMTDSSNALEAAVANQDILAKYDELAMKLAEAEAGQLNEYEIALLNAQIESGWKAEEAKAERDRIRLQQEEIGLKYA